MKDRSHRRVVWDTKSIGICTLGDPEEIGVTGQDTDMRLWSEEPNREDRVTA